MKELQKRIGENDQMIGTLVSKKEISRKAQQQARENNDSYTWEVEYDTQKKLSNKIEELEKENKVLEQALAILVGIDNWEEIR